MAPTCVSCEINTHTAEGKLPSRFDFVNSKPPTTEVQIVRHSEIKIKPE